MANVKIKFIDDINPGISTRVIVDTNVIKISIDYEYLDTIHCIYLDKSTAIKFAKTLRTEINKIEG